MWGFIISLISGALMSVQGVFNTEVTKQTSVWLSAAFVHISALAVCAAAWVVTGREGSISGLLSVSPKYVLLGGIMGAFITFTVIKGMDALGPAKAVMIIVTSQLIIAYLIELFGLFGVEKAAFEWRKLLGILIIAAGFITFKW